MGNSCCLAGGPERKYQGIREGHRIPQDLLSLKNIDFSSRCRLSGICDLEDEVRAQLCGNRTFHPSISKDAGLVFPSIVAKDRDIALECVTEPRDRVDKVKEAISWAWKGYEKCAGGEDELLPLTCSGQHWFNLTLTAVDSLDTLLIAGLEDEYLRAIDIVRQKAFNRTSGNCNVFETTIRILGGALSSYFQLEGAASERTKDTKKVLLKLAVDVGSRLFVSFESETGLPFSDVNLLTGQTSGSVSESSLSEMTTLALEFTALSRLTGDSKFEDASRRVYDILSNAVERYDGLLPQFFNPITGTSTGQYIMLGARTDSYYEYLLKQWIFTGKSDDLLKKRYIHAMQSVRTKLLRRTNFVPGGEYENGLLYVSERKGSAMSAKMDHLVCFLPGLFALGHFHGVSTALPKSLESFGNDTSELERNKHIWGDDLYIAEELANTCYELYRQSPTGLAPEIAHFFESEREYPHNHVSDVGGGYFYVKDLDAHNILRPETVESLYILWKVTGDPKYRERSWRIFRAFELWSRVEGFEHCITESDDAYDQIGSVVVKESLNRAIDVFVLGGSLDDAMERASTTIAELFEATRLSDVFSDYERGRLIVDAKENAYKSMQAIFEGLKCGSIRPGTPQPVSIDIEGCHHFGPSYGYAGIKSVLESPPKRLNKMESFWIAETLKYFYLIFSEPPDTCLHPSCAEELIEEAKYPLAKYVLNTEAHFFPIVGSRNDSRVHEVFLENLEMLLNPFVHSKTDKAEFTSRETTPESPNKDDEWLDDDLEIPYDPPEDIYTEVTYTKIQHTIEDKDENPQHTELR